MVPTMHWLLYRSLMTFVSVLLCQTAQAHCTSGTRDIWSSTYYPHDHVREWCEPQVFPLSHSPDGPGMVINLCDLLSRSIPAARWWRHIAMIAVGDRSNTFQLTVWNRTISRSCVLHWQVTCAVMCSAFFVPHAQAKQYLDSLAVDAALGNSLVPHRYEYCLFRL